MSGWTLEQAEADAAAAVHGCTVAPGALSRLADAFAARAGLTVLSALLLACVLWMLVPELYGGAVRWLNGGKKQAPGSHATHGAASPRQDKTKAASTDGSDAVMPSAEQTALLIRKRRSVFPKDFTGELLDRSQIETLLEAANWAPTHGRTEPWRFVVLGPAAREEMVDLTLKALQAVLPPEDAAKKVAKITAKRAGAYSKISHMVALCMKRQARPDKLQPEWEEMAAVACAAQNLQLQAAAMGVAGYWTSWYPDALAHPDMKAWLGLGPEDRCLGFYIAGRSDKMAAYRSAREPVADKTQWRV